MTISIIKLRFEVIKKLNIGSKKATIKADIPFEKINIDGKEKLYIPGSTIKGVLRSSMIRIAPLFGFNVKETINAEDLQKASEDVVCKILGKPNEYGKIIISDAYPEQQETEILTHIKIEDSTMVIKEGNLFKVEYLPIGSTFSCEIKCYDLTKDEMKLLLASVSQLNYERMGKCGLVNVKIDPSSMIPKEYFEDKIIKEIYEVIKHA